MRWRGPRPMHPAMPQLQEQLRTGHLDRREFLRTVPATFDWGERSNQARHILEYLTITGRDNITRPYLAEAWEASADLKTWTLTLRRNVHWSNGDVFNADDVVSNITRWLDPRIGSSNLGLFDALVTVTDTGKQDQNGKPVLSKSMTTGAVEKLDDSTVRLHLNRPVLAMPENLYHDMGADLSQHPIGTGAYALKEFVVGAKSVLAKRPAKDYWGPEAYLDTITYIAHGDDPSAQLAALASKQVDMVHEVGVESLPAVERLPHVVLQEVVTAQTGVARMQVTQKPFDDIRVRQAVQLCMDHRRLLELAHRGKGEPAENHHVAPSQPDYAPLPPPRQDHARARQLLTAAEYPNGLPLTIALGAADAWHITVMQAFKEMCAPAGITLNLHVMPGPSYWEVWAKVPFGFTSWTHRPLGVMTLELRYRSGVPWNESKYASPAFDKALDLAAATLDVNERRQHMAVVQKILQDDAVIAQPFWRSIFSATTKQVQGYATHPSLYHHFNGVWLT